MTHTSAILHFLDKEKIMSVVINGSSGVTVPIVYQNAQTISTNYTIPASTNAVSAGPSPSAQAML